MSAKHSSVQHSACGVMIVFCIAISGLSSLIGSSSVTSRPAPAIYLSSNARTSAASSWIGPRPTLR
jgi:hypothetical protein